LSRYNLLPQKHSTQEACCFQLTIQSNFVFHVTSRYCQLVCVYSMNESVHSIGGKTLTEENQSTQRKTYTNATLSTTSSTKNGPCLLGVRPATNCLSAEQPSVHFCPQQYESNPMPTENRSS